MRVNLFFRVSKDQELEKKVKGIEIIRLKSLVQFRKGDGLSKIYEAIVDTGAPVSVMPFRIWKEADCEILADHEVGGLAGGSLPIKVAKLPCFLTDREGNNI